VGFLPSPTIPDFNEMARWERFPTRFVGAGTCLPPLGAILQSIHKVTRDGGFAALQSVEKFGVVWEGESPSKLNQKLRRWLNEHFC